MGLEEDKEVTESVAERKEAVRVNFDKNNRGCMFYSHSFSGYTPAAIKSRIFFSTTGLSSL